MRFLDRYTGKYVDSKAIPNSIDLGRYAMLGTSLEEVTIRTYKPVDGQIIHQDFLDEAYKDSHDVLEKISHHCDAGDFSSVPLLQGIKEGLDFGDFATELEEELYHIEAIFQNPYCVLSRATEKVSVSKAKRISNRSFQYLASHTEDWLHKGLTSFHPARILTEESVLNVNVYENQLLIAFVLRASRYLERRLSHTRDISKFLDYYDTLMGQYKSDSGWHRRITRELKLAGDVYDEEGGNYHSEKSDKNIATRTQKRLRALKDKLLALRRYDLFDAIDLRRVRTISYHDSNVLVNHREYRYLKKLWLDLIDEELKLGMEENYSGDTLVVKYLQSYGLSLVNYVIKNYYNYHIEGIDYSWSASREGSLDLALSFKDGVISLFIDGKEIRFVTIGNLPLRQSSTILASDTYLLAYDAKDDVSSYSLLGDRIIPVSLRDINCAERLASIIRREMLKIYLHRTVFASYDYDLDLRPYISEIEQCFPFLSVDSHSGKYCFSKYPDLSKQHAQEFLDRVRSSQSYINSNHRDQSKINEKSIAFLSILSQNISFLCSNLVCFDLECVQKIEPWLCQDLRYIECTCGWVLDCTNSDWVKFYKKGEESLSPDDFGMDYIELSL